MATEYDLSKRVNPLEGEAELELPADTAPSILKGVDPASIENLGEADIDAPITPELVTGLPAAVSGTVPPLAILDATSTTTTKGSDTTTTTDNDSSRSYTEQSQASKDAAAMADQASLVERGYLEDEQRAKGEEARIEGELKEKEALQTAKWQEAKARAVEQGIADVRRDLDDINAMSAELTNMKPETFWGSKGTADKIAAALSVGLGSFAQATLGSGQNVGQVLLQRNMDEFAGQQKQKFDAKVKQIENLKATAEQKQRLFDDLEKQYDASRLAAVAQEQGMLARAAATAKTATVNAAIGQKMAASMQKQAALQLEISQKYEQKVEQKTSNRIVQNLKNVVEETRSSKTNPEAAKGSGGKGKARTAEQDKSLGFYHRMKDAELNTSALGDEAQLASKGALGNYFRDLEYNTASGDIPVIGGALQAGRYALKDTAEDRLKRADPDSYNYVNQARNFMAAVLRKESGASISPKEFVEGYRIYFPQPGDSPREIEQKTKLRRQATIDMGVAGGAND